MPGPKSTTLRMPSQSRGNCKAQNLKLLPRSESHQGGYIMAMHVWRCSLRVHLIPRQGPIRCQGWRVSGVQDHIVPKNSPCLLDEVPDVMRIAPTIPVLVLNLQESPPYDVCCIHSPSWLSFCR